MGLNFMSLQSFHRDYVDLPALEEVYRSDNDTKHYREDDAELRKPPVRLTWEDAKICHAY